MPYRILIVDDSRLIRGLLRKSIEAEGWYVCGEAADGREAIEQAQKLSPNLIILDLSMPILNGLDAAKILSKSMPEVPLVMFTSFSTHHLEQEAFAAGVRSLILKSESLSDLVMCVRALLIEAA